MLESINNNTFEYQRLSKEEMERRGILGRLIGPCADFISATRNGRHYSEKLWENVFNDPIMKERIENGVCYGELGHPLDREETDMEKIALCLAEVPKKGKDGKLRAVFDILNTPNGKILKALCDYGSTIGISSRGSGDLETDWDGNESVNPDTYTCEGFDAVLIPAVKEARLQYVNESLNKKRYNKTLRDKLTESIDKEDEANQKIIRESLNTLGIKLDESSNLPTKCLTTDELGELSDGFILTDNGFFDIEKNLSENQRVYGTWVGFEHTGRGDSSKRKKLIHVAYDDVLPAMANYLNVPEDSIEIDDKINALDMVRLYTIVDESDMEESLTEAKFGGYKYQYGVHVIGSDGNDRLLGGSETVDGAVDIAIRQAKQIVDNPWMSNTDKSNYISNMYIADDDAEHEIDTAFEDEADKILNMLNKPETDDINNDTFNESLGSGDQGKLNTTLYKYVWKALSDYADQYMTVEEDFSYSELKKAFGIIESKICGKYADKVNEAINQETDDINNEVTENFAADNDGALVEELQKALKLNKKLDEKIVALQEKLSAGYANEVKLNEQIEGYKSRIFKLSKSTNEVRALNEKLVTVNKSKETVDNRCKQLTESINKKNTTISELKESLNKKDEHINSLKVKVNESVKRLKAKTNSLNEITEKYETLNKDLNQLKESYSKKIEQQNALVEKYKNIAMKSVDKYIDTQAIRLGVHSSEIKNRLPESYSFKDIDLICEDLQEYKLNMSNLPFSTNSRLSRGISAKVSNVSQKTLVPMEEDIDELTLKLAGLL